MSYGLGVVAKVSNNFCPVLNILLANNTLSGLLEIRDLILGDEEATSKYFD